MLLSGRMPDFIPAKDKLLEIQNQKRQEPGGKKSFTPDRSTRISMYSNCSIYNNAANKRLLKMISLTDYIVNSFLP
jgi:hypothetical protein